MNVRYLLVAALAAFAATAAHAQTRAAEVTRPDGFDLLLLNDNAGFAVRGEIPVTPEDSVNIPTLGAGVRMMWWPDRWAFRAGMVNSFGATYWDVANVGIGSAAFGENTRASGDHSFAANLATTASGDESVALGNNGTASADRAFAFNGTASAVGAVAIGSGAQATGDDALALGPSSIAGGLASVTIGPSIARGSFGIAIGLQNSASGNFSVAIGKNARTNRRQGSIVIGDGCAGFSSDSVYATANNQIVMRGCGGIRLFTNQGLTSGVELAAGGSGWLAISDRNRKEHFRAVDGEDVLARLRRVPVTTWNYRSQADAIRHMGPMAQDFHREFGLGEDSLAINTVDMDGVTLAAVQALEARTREQDARIAELEARLASLGAGPSEPVNAALPVLGVLALVGLAGLGLRRRGSSPSEPRS
jgi:hypothetical protein